LDHAHGSIDTPDGTLTWYTSTADGPHTPDAGDLTADVVLTDLAMPLQLRTWTDGDRMAPLGMTGHQLVSDILTQRKVPAADRNGQWVLQDAAGQIVWLVGHRISRLVALPTSPSDATGQPLLHLSWTPSK
jgi:tRNA(Ile)-lysidine synthetase-like protein